MFNEKDKKIEGNFLDFDRDPYNQFRGEWVKISTSQRNEVGVYNGLTKSKLHVLRPYLANETNPNVPERAQSISFIIIDKPAFISDTPDIIVAPIRKEYVMQLVNLKLEEKIEDSKEQ